jgi:hypothetical protein
MANGFTNDGTIEPAAGSCEGSESMVIGPSIVVEARAGSFAGI